MVCGKNIEFMWISNNQLFRKYQINYVVCSVGSMVKINERWKETISALCGPICLLFLSLYIFVYFKKQKNWSNLFTDHLNSMRWTTEKTLMLH